MFMITLHTDVFASSHGGGGGSQGGGYHGGGYQGGGYHGGGYQGGGYHGGGYQGGGHQGGEYHGGGHQSGGYQGQSGVHSGAHGHSDYHRGGMTENSHGHSGAQHTMGHHINTHGFSNHAGRGYGGYNRGYGRGYNNWNYYGWWPYWNNGWIYGAAFGGVFTAAWFFPPWLYYEPYYPYPGPYSYPMVSDFSYNSYSDYPNSPMMYAEPVVPMAYSSVLERNEIWIKINNGRLPLNAVVNNNVNNTKTYYCRAKYMGKLNYGVLIPHDGCYIEKKSLTMRFTQYEVLVLD